MTNKDIAVIEKKLLPTIKEIERLTVVDEKSEIEASEMLSQLNLIGDSMKEKKAKVYDPAWQTVVAIRAEWKPREDMLSNAIDLIRGKLKKYRTDAKAAADAEAAKIADRVGEGKGKFKVETAVRKIEEIEQPTGSVATDAGIVKYKTVTKFEVTDMKALPIEYHIADEVAIRKAMLSGIKLQGVRYFTEEVPLNYR
jgi:hypothetical protein